MSSVSPRFFRAVLALALLATISMPSVFAQPGRGRRGFGGPAIAGGGFGRGGGIAGELRRGSVQEELQLTDEQRARIEELTRNRFDREQFDSFRSRMRAAQTDEERAAIQAEIQAAIQEQRSQTEAEIKKVLSDAQFQRVQQIRLHRAGPRALAEESVAQELGLSEKQRSELQVLAEARDAARSQLGFRLSNEEREAFQKEWDQKFLAVLSNSQKSAWEKKLGPPPPDGENDFRRGGLVRGDERPGAVRAESASSSEAKPLPRPRPQVVMTPPPEGAEVVSSFGAPAGEAAGRDKEEARFSFNFRYAPWPEVLKLFADRAGLTLDLEFTPPGTFNYFDDDVYTMTEALDILNGYLLPKGYVLIRNYRFLFCTVIDGERPIPPNMIPYVTIEEMLNQRGKNELLTVVFPLEGLDVNEIANEVEQLTGPQGKVVGMRATNSLVVTDIGQNLRRIHELLQKASGGPDDMLFKSYQVKNIPANEAENSIRAMLGLEVGVTDVSAGGNGGDRRFDPRLMERFRQMQTAAAPSSRKALVASDLRTNSLLVTASAGEHKIVEETLKVIDVPEQPGDFPFRTQKPYLVVYEVERADPREVVKTLGVLMPGVVVNEDGRNGLIHIQATEDQHREIALLIRQLDGAGGGQQIAVIPLAKMDPVTAAATIRAMFISDGENSPTVEPDLYGRQVMIRGSSDQITQAKQLLLSLGEDGTGRRQGGTSQLSRFSLMDRDPKEILEMFQQYSSRPVRVVYPNDRGPINAIRSLQPGQETRETTPKDPPIDSVRHDAPRYERRIPIWRASQVFSTTGAEPSKTESRPSSEPLSDEEIDSLLDLLENEPSAPAKSKPPASDPAETSDPVADVPAGKPKKSNTSNAPVTITVMGGELLISSSDPEAVAQAEEMLSRLVELIPPRTSWTVYPLEHADVMVVSTMLGELFPDSNVSSGSSGLSSMLGGFGGLTDGLSDLTGLSSLTSGSLTMIPYPTDNALFVSGPAYRVREVEEMLQLLDSGKLSASLRERTPKTIPVLHADIDDVYQVVKDVYHDFMETERDRGARNVGNMMAAMMGRGGQQQATTSKPSARLSLGVDRQTSRLIVSASQDLFQEIKTLVESLDTAALQARRSIRVVSLQNVSTSSVTDTVTSLMPRVTISSTSQRTSSGNSGSSNNRGTSPGGGSDQDRIRSFIEQRMRERALQSGGINGRPGAPGAGRPSPGLNRPGGNRPGPRGGGFFGGRGR